MKSKNKARNIIIIICILIFLISLIASLVMIYKPHSQTVQIIQDGKILYIIDLEKSEDTTIEIEYQNSKNIIQIQNHQISILDAECPDKTCVKMGELKSNATPIICLPNKLVIQFTELTEIDAEVR